MKLFKRNSTGLDLELKKLERHLELVLNPVAPRLAFINNLKIRLFAGDKPPETSRIPIKVSNILLVAGGVVGSVLMVIASVRGILSLINILGSFIQNRNSQKQQITPA